MTKRNAKAFPARTQDELHKPGAYRFFSHNGVDDAGFRFGCPCGCGLIGAVYLRDIGDKGPVWTLTGTMPAADLTPSIGFYGHNSRDQGYHWHGWLKAGVFEEC